MRKAFFISRRRFLLLGSIPVSEHAYLNLLPGGAIFACSHDFYSDNGSQVTGFLFVDILRRRM
jgi:hypothetical protein